MKVVDAKKRIITVLDTFSGIGGFTLAGELANADNRRRTFVQQSRGGGGTDSGGQEDSLAGCEFRTIAFAEIDPYASAVLAHRYPSIPNLGSVCDLTCDTLFSRTGYRTVDLITGGFPCQPHSTAGLRKANEDERDLWQECVRMLREIRPKFGLFENVRGLLTSAKGDFLNRVMSDLAEIGYGVLWNVIPASAVGAPHKRERVWIIVFDELADRESLGVQGHGATGFQEPTTYVEPFVSVCGGERGGVETLWPSRPGQPQFDWEPPRTVVGNAASQRSNRGGTYRTEQQSEVFGPRLEPASGMAHTKSGEWCKSQTGDRGEMSTGGSTEHLANTNQVRQQVTGDKSRLAPQPPSGGETKPYLGGNSNGVSTGIHTVAVQVESRTEDQDPTENRANRLKTLGNSIVPQVAAIFLIAIKEQFNGK